MTYAIDSLISIMRNLSSSEPVMFQRDHKFYVASKEGFGQTETGLRTWPLSDAEKEQFESYGKNTPGNQYFLEYCEQWRKSNRHIYELLESDDLILAFEGKGFLYPKPILKEGELPYIEPIMFRHDDNAFALEEMVKVAEQLETLPDDGNIRMISHSSGYRRHGYGVDGIDVNVEGARAMNREHYLQLMRQKEDNIYQDMIDRAPNVIKHLQISTPLEFPDCVIITPYLMFSFPRPGRIGYSGFEGWDAHTRFGKEMMRYKEFSQYLEAPFGARIRINAVDLADLADVADDFSQAKEIYKSIISKQLDVIDSEMEKINQLVDKLREMHRNAYSREPATSG